MDEQTNAPGRGPSAELDVAASGLEPRPGRQGRARSAILFVLVAAAWFALDVATKGWVSGGWQEGEVVTGPILGLVRFHLVHNTGMAWGMFGDSTFRARRAVACRVRRRDRLPFRVLAEARHA